MTVEFELTDDAGGEGREEAMNPPPPPPVPPPITVFDSDPITSVSSIAVG